MSNYATLKSAISTAIKQNGNEEITGQVLQTTLLSMVDSLVSGYLFKGIATPSTVVGTPDENVFWIAPAGSYSNFGATPIDVPTGCIGIFQYNGSFTNTVVYVGGTVDISALSHTAYASLSQALGDLPAALHIGGIEVRYQDSITSKFVKYRLMATSWSTIEANWQGVDDEPTAGSDNLVKSGGVYSELSDIKLEIGNEVVIEERVYQDLVEDYIYLPFKNTLIYLEFEEVPSSLTAYFAGNTWTDRNYFTQVTDTLYTTTVRSVDSKLYVGVNGGASGISGKLYYKDANNLLAKINQNKDLSNSIDKILNGKEILFGSFELDENDKIVKTFTTLQKGRVRLYIQGIAENKTIQCFVCNSSFQNRIYLTTSASKDGFFTAYIDKDDIDTICCIYTDGDNPLTLLLYYDENVSITNYVNSLIKDVGYLSGVAGKEENIELLLAGSTAVSYEKAVAIKKDTKIKINATTNASSITNLITYYNGNVGQKRFTWTTGILTNEVEVIAPENITSIGVYCKGEDGKIIDVTFKIQGSGVVDTVNPLKKKNVVVLGDSHAQNREMWLPYLCELTGMNYLSSLNSQLNVGNTVASQYEMYFHPLRAQLQALIDNRGNTDVDVIIVENVHYRPAGNASTYAYHPSQMIDLGEKNMTEAEEEAYWQANYNTVLGNIDVANRLGDTLLKESISAISRKITFSASSISAGVFSLTIDGHVFATDITAGMTLAQAVEDINSWSFGDYCDWVNIEHNNNSITIRYKGSGDASISLSYDGGTTGISCSVGDNTETSRGVYRYYESAEITNWLDIDKWHKMNFYFYNGYLTLKGFFEDININFPNAKVIVLNLANYEFASFDAHLNMGEFMQTSEYLDSKAINEQMRDVAKLYACQVIDVENECGINPFNWFEFYNANNVHPRENGYRRWAETIAKFMI